MRIALAVLGVSLCALSARAQTVDQVVASHAGGCTTAGVEGLSNQLVRSHLCAYPGAVAEFTPHPNITLTSSRVHPFGVSQTVAALRAAANVTPLRVNSAFRTMVEQYLLYEEGGCGLAAQPGNSNHQSGRAVDLQNYSAARSAMLAQGCTHPYPSSDPVHFDCPGPDMRQASVLVFQRLWNRNNPSDLIDEDGVYGPQTKNRLGRSPAAGFANDLCVTEPVAQWGAQYVMQTFPVASADPIVLRPGEEMLGTIEMENIGTETWNASTRLGTTEPRDHASPLAASDWVSPSRADQVDGTVAPGDSYPFTFSLRGPSMPGEYCQFFGVVQEGVTWFSDAGHLGPPDNLLQVCVLVEEGAPPVLVDAGPATDASAPPVSDDASVVLPPRDASVAVEGDAGPHGGGIESGCACSLAGRPRGGAGLGWLLGLGLALLVAGRRARRRA